MNFTEEVFGPYKNMDFEFEAMDYLTNDADEHQSCLENCLREMRNIGVEVLNDNVRSNLYNIFVCEHLVFVIIDSKDHIGILNIKKARTI